MTISSFRHHGDIDAVIRPLKLGEDVSAYKDKAREVRMGVV